jgi:hypothetical protein
VAISTAPIAVLCKKAGEGEFGLMGRCGPDSVGLAQRKVPLLFLQKISNQFELIRFNSGLPEFIKFQINYGCEGFEVRNNFPYRNFLILKNNFGLKFKEFSRV